MLYIWYLNLQRFINMSLVLKFFKNKVLLYTLSRYFTYAIQFVGALFIAKYLGTYYLGVWGFILLIIQYFSKVNFGISNATNALVSVHKSDTEYIQKIVGGGIGMLFLLSFIIVLLWGGFYLLDIELGAKYHFIQYIPYVIAITIISHFNLFFSNIFRIYGQLANIAFSRSVVPIALLVVAFLYKGEQLVFALILAYLFAVLASFLIFIITSPVSLKPVFDIRLFRLIQVKGFYLFVYNASFYLIVLSTRSFISDYYSVEEFGFFTFAYTLASAVLLLFQSFSFLIYPKILNRFANQTNEQAVALLNLLRGSYVTVCHFSMHLGILFYPLLLMFFSEYASTHKIFVMIALTVLVFTNTFGYQGLIIARSKEKKIALIAFVALLFNIFLNVIFIVNFIVPIEFSMLATMFVFLIYVFVLAKLGRKTIDQNSSFLSTLYSAFNIRWVFPFLLSIVITIAIDKVTLWYILPLGLFIVLNYKGLMEVYSTIKKIVVNPNVIDL